MADRVSVPQPCWTCRLRKTGCDGAEPECGNCRYFGIECQGYSTKPEWMDGGTKEEEMTQLILYQRIQTLQRQIHARNSLQSASSQNEEMVDRTSVSRTCWTCRLRKTGCDGAEPECYNCRMLGIKCHGYSTKPEWMDGGTKEEEMNESIQQQIKDFAIRRLQGFQRLQRQIQAQRGSNGNSTQSIVTTQYHLVPGNRVTQASSSLTPMLARSLTSSREIAAQDKLSEMEERVKIATSILNPIPGSSNSSSGRLETPKTSADAWVLDVIMIYLDHVFPFLFPFYQPPLVGTSRAWLLSFVKQNDSVFLSVLSLGSFFFMVGQKEIFQDQLQLCSRTLLDQVCKQAKTAFEAIGKEIQELNNPEYDYSSILRKAQRMETFVQLLISDRFIDGTDGWNKQLDAALDIFEELLVDPSFELSTQTGFDCVLNELKLPGPHVVGIEKVLWNGNQAAFRFFTAVLIQLDIIASTSLERYPRLQILYGQLLGELPVHEIGTPLNLAYFIGCSNWVLTTIADISALDAWKKSMISIQNLSQVQLLDRSKDLFGRLQKGIEDIERAPVLEPERNDTDRWRLKPYYRSPSQLTSAGLEDTANKIWTYAAHIYLLVVSFGWKPSDLQIRKDVARATELLATVESPAQMRTLSWPVCVVGCMADGEAEKKIIDSIIEKADQSPLLSSIRAAGKIIKEVRNSPFDPARDFASCFKRAGKPILLF